MALLRGKSTVSKKVVRGTIPVESVTASYMIDDEVGYIKVERFSIETAREFRAAAYELRQQGLTVDS